MSKTDDKFYERADEHINLSNSQLQETEKGKVSASMMYSVARFNAWVTACGFSEKEEMKEKKEEVLDYFVTQYKIMLEENLDEYIENFEEYMK
ncbi:MULTISPECIES: DUF3144 domain-containing protein [unclassified Flammeovirga]|uniref:DUF3144 domain-containing protein n=1 Tax=unclassified Flammeovirga TaxID=2637820 RepID=UPI0005C46511|nr:MULTISPECIES: DUF3144 domain-containing protein [unclassified Flammeovirga]KXX71854.1 hypothetical protein AVL50_03460 [Flammeovirga sp. SJP92]